MELLKLQDAFHCAVGWSLGCVHRLGCAALGGRAKVNWSSLLREAVLTQGSVSLRSQPRACARVPSTPGLLLPWPEPWVWAHEMVSPCLACALYLGTDKELTTPRSLPGMFGREPVFSFCPCSSLSWPPRPSSPPRHHSLCPAVPGWMYHGLWEPTEGRARRTLWLVRSL